MKVSSALVVVALMTIPSATFGSHLRTRHTELSQPQQLQEEDQLQRRRRQQSTTSPTMITVQPSPSPSVSPTSSPSESPSVNPTPSPSESPSIEPTFSATTLESPNPTSTPTSLQSQDQQQQTVGTTQQDNVFTINFPDNQVSDVSCTWQAINITPGQPYGGMTCEVTNDHQITFHVYAGRHGSTGPADFFKSGMTFENMLGLETPYDSMPDTLNFAVQFTFQFTMDGTVYTLRKFRLGQGHYLSVNNWWVAHTSCADTGYYADVDALKCASDGPSQDTFIINALSSHNANTMEIHSSYP